ncbi:MAG: arginine deiminase-related protein, partial [Steroidobacteraceae bacterium]
MNQRVGQCAGTVFMVQPAAFAFNAQTAASNPLQASASVDSSTTQLARAEFAGLAQALQSEGVRTIIGADTPEPAKPDAIFPNNWVSFHADGTVVLYPMHAANRRTERRREVVDAVAEQSGFRITRVLDLSPHERE